MRTLIIIFCGLGLWAVAVGLARHFGKPGGSAVSATTLAFNTFWLLATATNFWLGVARTGHTAREDMPIAALIWGVPVAVALIAKWKFS